MSHHKKVFSTISATAFGLLILLGVFSCQKSDVLTTNTTVNNSKDTTLTSSAPKTAGTLAISTLTSNAGGSYAPRNIVAIWVETGAGTFVKSLMVLAQSRRSHLTNWGSKSGSNTTDAITGATQSNHSTRSCNWDGTNTSRTVVPDGTYRVCMELTDKNGTGNFHTFNFTKGIVTSTLTPSSVSSFSSISIKWTPK
ncbi:MAG: DUF2271 domain-containing protein [Bacteroidales bacterium]|nr:DUF2271 domain-containing protein [Bacteroidales bacterium]